jgi:hypothetical protein
MALLVGLPELVDESEFSLVDIIPKWFSVLTYYLGDEQKARQWRQFRDVVVSPHRHDGEDHHHHHHHHGLRYYQHTQQETLRKP